MKVKEEKMTLDELRTAKRDAILAVAARHGQRGDEFSEFQSFV
jgi:hypothetical protein